MKRRNLSALGARLLALGFVLQLGTPSLAQGQSLTDEVRSRQLALMRAIPQGIIVLPAQSEAKDMEQPAWIQEPIFYYFTSLASAPGAILVLDAPKERVLLFAGNVPESFGVPLDDLHVLNRSDWAEQSGVSAVLPFSAFKSYIQTRLNDGVDTLYLDEPRRSEPNEVPGGMLHVAGFHRLWRQSLESTFPEATIASAAPAIDALIWVKSAREIDQLRKNAAATAAALRAGMQRIQPGISQRIAEVAVVSACFEEGMDGPSFWPWVMTGPNAHIRQVVKSFYSNTHLNKPYENGELVRVDVGCFASGYGSDVGRTVPVLGTFSSEQAIVWDALIAGYQAGIRSMKDGAALEDITRAAQEGLKAWSTLHPEAKDVTSLMTGPDGVAWHIHGVGIESAETALPILREGTVIAFEPMFSLEKDAYYLEDMILITKNGAEILSEGLPYDADAMHTFLARNR